MLSSFISWNEGIACVGGMTCYGKITHFSSYMIMCECKASTWDDGVIMRVSQNCSCSCTTFRGVALYCVVILYLVTPMLVEISTYCKHTIVSCRVALCYGVLCSFPATGKAFEDGISSHTTAYEDEQPVQEDGTYCYILLHLPRVRRGGMYTCKIIVKNRSHCRVAYTVGASQISNEHLDAEVDEVATVTSATVPAACTSTGFKEQSTAQPLPAYRWTHTSDPSSAESAHLRQTIHPPRAPDNQPQFAQSRPPRPGMATADSYSNTMQSLVHETMQKMLQSWYQTGYVCFCSS